MAPFIMKQILVISIDSLVNTNIAKQMLRHLFCLNERSSIVFAEHSDKTCSLVSKHIFWQHVTVTWSSMILFSLIIEISSLANIVLLSQSGKFQFNTELSKITPKRVKTSLVWNWIELLLIIIEIAASMKLGLCCWKLFF